MDEFAKDAPLREEEYKVIDKAIKEVVREQLWATKVFSRVNVDIGTLEYGWDQWKDIGEATIDLYGETENYDELDLGARKTIKVPLIHKEFILRWRIIEAARRGGRNLETAAVEFAAAKIAEKVEQMIFKGDSTYGIEGIFNATGIQTVQGADFGTAGNAYETFRKARDALQDDNITGTYVAFLNPAQYGELDILFTQTGIPQREKIVGNFVSAIYPTTQVPAGEGYVVATAKRYVGYLGLPGVKRTPLWQHPIRRDVFGRLYTIAVPYVREPLAIVKLSGI